jgi:hypothetical protein
VSVWDTVGYLYGDPKFYNFTLTAWVSRRNDVAVSSVIASLTEVDPGENISIQVIVKNQGAVNETFNVTAYRNNTVIGTQTVSDLPPGNETTLTFQWNTSGVTSGDYKIRAEACNVSGEWDTEDNAKADGTVKVLNLPPETPLKPSGTQSGGTGLEYTYFSSTTDPNGDSLTYVFDWGDSTHQTVGPFGSGENASAAHKWMFPGIFNVTVKAYDNYAWSNWSKPLTVNMAAAIWYMRSDKWDSTYWKLFWNNTITSTYKTVYKFQYCLYGDLGVKIYKGTTCISGADPIKVGSWYNTQSCLKNYKWNCDEYNVTGTYIKIEIYYRFAGGSWQNMGVAFKTETFTENTILNATKWNIYLYGEFQMEWGPLSTMSPPQDKAALTFYWGSSNEESRIEDMIFTQ